MDDPPRTEALAKVGEISRRRIVGQFGLFFGIEVVKVAEEFVETMICWQELVQVAKVVLAELTGCVADWLEQGGNCRILGLNPNGRSRNPDLTQASAVDTLSSDEG